MPGSTSFSKTLAVASFAVWRWETLGAVCIDVWAPLTMLRDSFHLLQPLLKQMKHLVVLKHEAARKGPSSSADFVID